MKFTELPIEIIELIIGFLPQNEVLNFGLTGKGYHDLAMKKLYETLLIYIPSFRQMTYDKSNYFLLSNWSIIMLDAQELYDENNFPIDMYYLISKKLEVILSKENENLKYVKNLLIKGILRVEFIKDIFNQLIDNGRKDDYIFKNLKQLLINVPNTGSDYVNNNKHIQFQISSKILSSFDYNLTNLQINIVELFRLTEVDEKDEDFSVNEKIIDSFKNIKSLQIFILRQNLTYNDKNYRIIESFRSLKNLSLKDTSYNSGVMKFINWLQYSTFFQVNRMKLNSLEILLVHPYTTHLLPLKLDPEPFKKIIELNEMTKFDCYISCSNKSLNHVCRCETEFMNRFDLANLEEFILNCLDYHRISFNSYIKKLRKLKRIMILNIEYLDSYEKVDSDTSLVDFLKYLPSDIRLIHIHSFFQALNFRHEFINLLESRLSCYNLYDLNNIVQNIIIEYQNAMFESIDSNILYEEFNFWNFPIIKSLNERIIKNINIISSHNNYNGLSEAKEADLKYAKLTNFHIIEILKNCILYSKDLVVYLISKYKSLVRINLGILQYDINYDYDGKKFAVCSQFDPDTKFYAIDDDEDLKFPDLI